jgi:DNA mismatch endonuclease (patch repair protein)
MDVHTKEQRSYNMSRIRAENTKPEISVRKYLHSKGFRYRLHDTKLPGKPDIVLPKYKTVIFVHGCFWHGHNCKKSSLPTSNVSYWHNKIVNNKKRDAFVKTQLKKIGWAVFTIWSCKMNNEKVLEKIVHNLKQRNSM